MKSQRNRPHWWSSRKLNVEHVPLKVLIVDDYEIGAVALQEYLNLEGMDCHSVFRGIEAIAEGITWQPHVIIMDISMPEVNGYEAARELRKTEATSGLLIIAFTALDEHEVQRNLTSNEFDGYCQKGISPDRLVAFIKSIMA